eukprot:gene5914-6155_t
MSSAHIGGSRFKVVDPEPLGKGANGSVYKALDMVANELVVVKVINKLTCNGYVTSELLNHQLLNHPHVIGFRGVWVSSKSINIVMELADGGTLLEYVNGHTQHKLPEELARYFFQQLMLAVDYCHKKGVANRDIKLDNILLHKVDGQLPTLKLCDWGYSKETEYNAKTAVGTLHYMAPQPFSNLVKRRETAYSAKAADIWSCGVCLYAMLTCCYPFTYDMTNKAPMNPSVMLERMEKQGWRRPEVVGHLSQPVLQLLEGLLAYDENQRLTIAQIEANDWFKINLHPTAFTNNDAWVQQPVQNGMQSAEEIEELMISALGSDKGARQHHRK